MNENKIPTLSDLIGGMTNILSSIYSSAIFQFVSLAVRHYISFGGLGLFTNSSPATYREFSDIVSKLSSSVFSVILGNINSAWELSNHKNDKIVEGFFGNRYDAMKDRIKEVYQQPNLEAREEFIKRKTNGLDLSDRVWNYNKGYQKEIDDAIQIGVSNGIGKDQMGEYLTKFLQNPSATILEVDEKGIAKEIATPKVGVGVYRDPLKNAQRLARTETNMAYRTADQVRWRQMDFVLGYEIKLSHNHTTLIKGKRVELFDICDELQGKYPKDFVFPGWHPQCRCFTTPIIINDEEQRQRTFDILDGIAPSDNSDKMIKDVPDNFKEWRDRNAGRLLGSKSLPYFVRDNPKYFSALKFGPVIASQFTENTIFQ